jgi:hypothetical protein
MIRRTCFPSTLRLMPVIRESTSVNSRPSFDAMTWPVQATVLAAVASMRVEAGRVNDDVEFVLGLAGLDDFAALCVEGAECWSADCG